MKYYYKGQLIRTSKNHKYTHAVIKAQGEKIICLGCSASKDGAAKIKQKEAGFHERIIANYEKAIAALKDGRNGYYHKDGRSEIFVRFGKDSTIDYYEKGIKSAKEELKKIYKWEVVEIESK